MSKKSFFLGFMIMILFFLSACSEPDVNNVTNMYGASCDPACEKWELCNEDSKACELAFLACNEDSDCLDGEICVIDKHRCLNTNKKDALGIEGNSCYEDSCDAGLECLNSICTRNEQLSSSTVILSNKEIEKNIIANDNNIISIKRNERNERLRINNILTAGITEKTPYGLLKKVKTIRRFDDYLEIEVEDAKLEEAVIEADIDLEKTIPISIESETKGLNSSTSFDVNLDVPTENPFFTANGSVTLSTNLDFNVKIKIWRLKLKEFKLILGLSAITDLEIALNTPSLFKQEGDIGSVKINLTPITIMVGPVPVVIVSTISIPIHYEIDVTGKFSAGVTFGPILRVGTIYDGDNWQEISEVTFEKSIQNPKISLDGSFKVGPKVVLSTKLYGVAGPEVSIGAYAELSGSIGIDLEGQISWEAKLKAVAEASFKFTASILGKSISGLTFKVSKFIDIWEKSGLLTCTSDSDCMGSNETMICLDYKCVLESHLCPDNSCSNHGVCNILNKEAYCDCEDGFSATENLECLASCEGVTCDDHGECILIDGEFPTCDCEEGYERFNNTRCLQSGCTVNSCGQHGHCVDGIECNCDIAYSYNSDSKLCEASCDNIDCGVGECELLNEVATCNCPNGYYPDSLFNCIEGVNPCDNYNCGENEICIPDEMGAVCICQTGYNFDENNSCVQDGNEEIDYCEGITCSGNGVCTNDEINGATCKCNDGFHRETQTTCVVDGDWDMVKTREYQSCGIKGGALYCWGPNYSGKLGISSDLNKSYGKPQQVGVSTSWSNIFYGIDIVCGINQTKLYCWGKNIANHPVIMDNASSGWSDFSEIYGIKNGKLYKFDFTDSYIPIELDNESGWSKITNGFGIKNGALYSISNQIEQIGTETDWYDISAHYHHSYRRQCGIRDNGKLYCWGYKRDNDYHQDEFPVRVGNTFNWETISIESFGYCGIRNGELYCWGNDYFESRYGLGDAPSNLHEPQNIILPSN